MNRGMLRATQNSVRVKITSAETERNRLTSNTSDNCVGLLLLSCMNVGVYLSLCVSHVLVRVLGASVFAIN